MASSLTRYDATLSIDPEGKAVVLRRGEADLVVRYQSQVVSTRLAGSRPLSVLGLVCGNPNLCAVNPAGSVFTFCAHSRHDALSSMLRGAA